MGKAIMLVIDSYTKFLMSYGMVVVSLVGIVVAIMLWTVVVDTWHRYVKRQDGDD